MKNLNLPTVVAGSLTPSSEMRAAHRLWIKGRIATLLSHWGVFPEDQRTVKARGDDWADVLQDLTQAQIEAGISTFLRTEDRRPVPATIRRLALKSTPSQRQKPDEAKEERPRVSEKVKAELKCLAAEMTRKAAANG